MLKNYHTHTSLCGHAEGTMEEYVKAAIDGGLQVLGFSDHAPVAAFPNGYYSNCRMRPKDLPFYAESVLSLKEKYKDQIKIYLGFEFEYYPELFQSSLALLDTVPYDYLILGQHYVDNEYDRGLCQNMGTNVKLLELWVSQVITGMKTGRFCYVAHPDYMIYTGDDQSYKETMEPLLKTALELDMPLECNLLGVRDHRHYPTHRFFKLAAEYGCKVILGIDAHDPAALRNHDDKEQALQMLKECGVTNIVQDI